MQAFSCEIFKNGGTSHGPFASAENLVFMKSCLRQLTVWTWKRHWWLWWIHLCIWLKIIGESLVYGH